MKCFLQPAALASLIALSACQTLDKQDQTLLGEATRANIEAQAVRDVNLPNSKAVDSTSGVRAVAAVKALNEGQTKQLASNGTGASD